jgi:hypothetical protein
VEQHSEELVALNLIGVTQLGGAEAECAIGYVDDAGNVTGSSIAERMLASVPAGTSGRIDVSRAACIAMPPDLEQERALAVPTLACALWGWDTLQLELGDTAIYTCGSPLLERAIAAAAVWRGGLPVIRLSAEMAATPLDGVEDVSIGDAQQAISRLSAIAGRAPGFAAIDLGGRADVLDILFEVLPRWSRVLLGARSTAPLTVDFYNNVHRKGVRMRTTRLDPSRVLDPALRTQFAPFIERAIRILTNDELARHVQPVV